MISHTNCSIITKNTKNPNGSTMTAASRAAAPRHHPAAAAPARRARTAGALAPSQVLRAIGLPHEVAHGSLRLSVGEYNTDEEMASIVDNVRQVVAYLRSISPVWDELETGARPHLI